VPNAIGAAVVFNGAATVDNVEQSANRIITLVGTKTVGSIVFNNDLSTFTNNVSVGTGGPLAFDAAGAGPATINVPAAAGTGNNTISAAMQFDDTVVATVDNITASSATGALNFTGTIAGSGGFTKLGLGLATFGTGAKTYSGPTEINNGRLRMSNAAQASATSSFTVGNGGQVVFISSGTYSLGSGPLNLNGAGPTSGPGAQFPGALRPDRNAAGRQYTITNDVVLQSDSLIHVHAMPDPGADHSLTLSGNISGVGQLEFTAANTGEPYLGRLLLTGAENTYSGGTLVRGGTLEASGALTSLGNGDVTILSGSLLPDFGATAISKLLIQAGDGNAIADTATLSLGGGSLDIAGGTASILELLTSETVYGLILGTATQSPGTYGSSTSGATNQFDEYFAGSGVLTVQPGLGDANSDGFVDDKDASALGAHWLMSDATWEMGDFNGDHNVNDADAAILAAHWGEGVGEESVPEPGSLALLAGIVVMGLLCLRRRKA
jgi:autotransporter-associated beta strand protein